MEAEENQETRVTRASYGMTVTLIEESTKQETVYFLVRAEEENWQEKKISMYHPIGRYIFTKVVGNVVEIPDATGKVSRFRITNIEPT